MKPAVFLLISCAFLAACGGNRVDRFAGGVEYRTASGPISAACNRSDRRASNPRLCGCIQAAANRQLSSSDQRLAAKFFRDPHLSQEIRQSDRRSHEIFWKRYKDFASNAERQCQGL